LSQLQEYKMNLSSRAFLLFLSGILLLSGSAAGLAQNTPGYNNKIPESIRTPDHVKTPIGDLNFFDGMPDETTVQKLYDNLIFMRGVEAFLSGIPATSIEAIRLGCVEVGAKRASDVVLLDKLMDSDPLFPPETRIRFTHWLPSSWIGMARRSL
jgi:hypothetical protein